MKEIFKTAVHTYSTAPSKARGFAFKGLPEYMVSVMIQSACRWEENNGPIVLCADKDFIDWVTLAGLADMYIDIVQIEPDPRINHHIFWAANKLQAMDVLGCDLWYLDNDLILNSPIPDMDGANLAVGHDDKLKTTEGTTFHYQMLGKHYSEPEGYIKPAWVRQKANNWLGLRTSIMDDTAYVLNGLNTSIFWTNDIGYHTEYVKESLRFMYNNPCTNPFSGWALMVWAEQVMALDCAIEYEMTYQQIRDHLKNDFFHLQNIKHYLDEENQAKFLSLQKLTVRESEIWERYKHSQVYGMHEQHRQTY